MLLLIPPPEVNCVEASSDNTFYSSLLESAALGLDEGLWNLNILNVMSSLNQLSVPLKSFSISHSFIVLKSVWILWQSSKVCIVCECEPEWAYVCVCFPFFSRIHILMKAYDTHYPLPNQPITHHRSWPRPCSWSCLWPRLFLTPDLMFYLLCSALT